jgi:UDP-N-acetylmuramoyl-tripeptide--D-alanyl-D-alanine ligase
MSIAALYELYLQHPHVQTDTRKLQPGEMYFALKGPSFNGNNFAAQALAAGASVAVIDEPQPITDPRLVLVPDVLTTLQALALHHRKQFTIPVIAITGSNGKTTTKELVHEVLSTRFTTYTTRGNLNNHIGVPLTLLSIGADAQMAVIEMGANHQKEIESYCTYTLPTHGIITNCGKAHLEGFGGVEGVRKGKGELYDFIRANAGTIFLMQDYDYLHTMATGIKNIVSYGTTNADFTGTALPQKEMLEVVMDKGTTATPIRTQLVGAYNLPNVLVAVAVGKYFGVPDADIKNALENYIPSNSRSQLISKGSNKIILDAYNANPTSMRAAIENIAAIAGDKVLLLGGMMEMGEDSIAEHAAIIALINQYKWKAVALVGGDFDGVAHSYCYFANSSEAAIWYRQQQWQNCTLLIKGSRSMKMERLLDAE